MSAASDDLAPVLTTGPPATAGGGDAGPSLSERLHAWLLPLIGVALFAAALLVLRRELRAVSYAQLSAAVFAIPGGRLALAGFLTAFNYALFTGYDQLAFAYVGRHLSRWRIALASFVAYSIANNVGFAALSGSTVRYRFYTRWGVTAGELSRIVLFYSATFWLGLLVLGGVTLLGSPLPLLVGGPGPGWARLLGTLLLLIAGAYAVTPMLRRSPIRLGRFVLPLPPLRLVAAQFVLSILDWIIAAAVLDSLLPRGAVPFRSVLSAFVAAQVLGLVSHLPGGLGVFESVMVVLLRGQVHPSVLLPVLLVYRLIYYLLPLAVALVALLADELAQRRAEAARVGALFGALTEEVAPRLLAVFTFVAGAALLFSEATPATSGRIGPLSGVVPLPVLEGSHFAGGVVGVGLLLLSYGIARRLASSYSLVAAALLAGLVAAVLKGGDYEVATLLGALLVLLAAGRGLFDRELSFFATRFAPAWVFAVGAVAAASVWLAFFSYEHVEYSTELWWQFDFERDVSRTLRAAVGAVVVLVGFVLLRLARPAPALEAPPSARDLSDADLAIAAQRSTVPLLVHLRDKALLFSETRDAYVAYRVQGLTWVAMGDPVGPAERAARLVRDFVERCDDFEGVPVFFRVDEAGLGRYADFGLAVTKVGDDARVPLGRLSREAAPASSFRVAPKEEVPALMPELRDVSDAWLAPKGGRELGFTQGFFDPRYVARFPVALLAPRGRIEAFAAVWPGPGREELSFDLLRHRDRADESQADDLLRNLMLWGRQAGFTWFRLGLAPPSGAELAAVAPLWTRLEPGADLGRLRLRQDVHAPVRGAQYVAYPGGLEVSPLLADVAALITGGYRRLLVP